MRALVACGLALTVAGCGLTVMHADGSNWALHPGMVPQKNTVQTMDFTVVGIEIDAAREALTVGYKAGRITLTPVAMCAENPAEGTETLRCSEVEWSVPRVESTKTVESSLRGGTRITDTLNIGDKK